MLRWSHNVKRAFVETSNRNHQINILFNTSWVAGLCQARQLDPPKNTPLILHGLNALTPSWKIKFKYHWIVKFVYWIFQWYLTSYYSMILIWCYYLVSFKQSNILTYLMGYLTTILPYTFAKWIMMVPPVDSATAN